MVLNMGNRGSYHFAYIIYIYNNHLLIIRMYMQTLRTMIAHPTWRRWNFIEHYSGA